MSTAYLDPDENGATLEWNNPLGIPHWDVVNDAVRQPTNPGGTALSAGGNWAVTKTEILGVSSVAGISQATAFTLWVFGWYSQTFSGNHVTIYWCKGGGTWTSLGSISGTTGAVPTWWNFTVTDLTLSQSELDGLQFKFVFTGSGGELTLTFWIDEFYVVLTYTPAALAAPYTQQRRRH